MAAPDLGTVQPREGVQKRAVDGSVRWGPLEPEKLLHAHPSHLGACDGFRGASRGCRGKKDTELEYRTFRAITDEGSTVNPQLPGGRFDASLLLELPACSVERILPRLHLAPRKLPTSRQDGGIGEPLGDQDRPPSGGTFPHCP